MGGEMNCDISGTDVSFTISLPLETATKEKRDAKVELGAAACTSPLTFDAVCNLVNQSQRLGSGKTNTGLPLGYTSGAAMMADAAGMMDAGNSKLKECRGYCFFYYITSVGFIELMSSFLTYVRRLLLNLHCITKRIHSYRKFLRYNLPSPRLERCRFP